MSSDSRRQTIMVPWRRVCAALPAVALIGGGIVFAAQAAPAQDVKRLAAVSDAAAIEVPDTALTMPAVPSPAWTDGTQAVPTSPALVLPAGTIPGSSGAIALDSDGIPVRALEAYRTAATLVEAADPASHLDWALLAAIGRVESNHARFGANQLDAGGVAQPGIIGIPLDGSHGTARITDSDNGLLDRDLVFDRAVGPMQFIPSTWRSVGVDADRDGAKNPQDMTDAATATAIYLCSGPGDLSRPDELSAALMRYNASDSYGRTVAAIADAYRNGVSVIPASDLPAASVTPASGPATTAPPTGAPAFPGGPVTVAPAVPGAALTFAAVPDPTTTVAPVPDPTTTTAPVPDPTTTVAPVPDPTTTTAPVPDPCLAGTDPTAPATTTPCPTSTTLTATAPTPTA